MGRKKTYRQKLIDQAKRVAIKNPFNWLIHLSINDYGLSPREAELVAIKAYSYINQQKQGRSFEQICFKLISGRNSHSRKHNKSLKKATLTPFSYTDLELFEEFGLRVMQNARIYRLIEEAYAQDAIFSLKSLSFLTGLQTDALRKRLMPLWKEQIRLPISGMKKDWRNFRCYRATKALELIFSGLKLSEIRRKLALSRNELSRYRMEYDMMRQGHAPTFVELLPGLEQEYKSLIKEDRSTSLSCNGENYAEKDLFSILQTEHNFSRGKAKDYIQRLDEFLQEECNNDREDNTIIYFAISEEEPAGKPLFECDLIAVTIDYYTLQELDQYNGKKIRCLEWERILRYTTQARLSGGLLTQADLAFLMGVDTSVIRLLLKENPAIVVPTRGQIVDMGSGVTHREKIIELYLEGYTETQIKQKTGHSYESIENYLKTFASIVILSDRNMPISMIRKATGKSKKLVENHFEIYAKHKQNPGSQLVLMQLRNSFLKENNNPFFSAIRLEGGDTIIKKRANMYNAFSERNLENVQLYELFMRFDFSRESWLARKIIADFNHMMDCFEQENGVERLKIGELLAVHKDQPVVIPLLDQSIIQGLAKDGLWSKHSVCLEDMRLDALQTFDPEATREDLRRLTNIRNLVFKRRSGLQRKKESISESWALVNPKEVDDNLCARVIDREEVTVPKNVYHNMMAKMTDEEPISKERARAIVEELAYIRALFYPLQSELVPGQVVWNGIAISDRQQHEKSTRYRKQIPLVLTLQKENEKGTPISLDEVNRIHKKQIARMCVEAYLQGSVLTLTDLHLLVFRSVASISSIVTEYMMDNKVILPTAGTVKDAGRTMTHKNLVIDLHLSGLYTKEIARKTWHSEDAVDRYLDLFYSVLILYIYDLPIKHMAKVTGRGQTLIAEHVRIAQKYFPDKNAVKNYLKEQGVEIV